MLTFKTNQSLKALNTFGINALAKYFVEITTVEDLKTLVKHSTFLNNKVLWLGGGSNMLLTGDFEGLVVKLSLTGIAVDKETSNTVRISVMAGENWHNLVLYTLQQNWGGLENLSLIPGNTGTAPIQNIGAYGVELKDTFYALEALEIASGELKTFTKEECAFGYRDSFFKREGKGKYVITKVFFQLTKANHTLHTEYGAITDAMQELALPKTIQGVSKAVISIRESKLPNPKEIGNSGSFFKNPIVQKETLERLQQEFPKMPFYTLQNGGIKLAAGWLIEQSGLKGYRKGDAGVHQKQALVLVNYGNATGAEILNLAEHVKRTVFDTFAVPLEAEVNLI